ncbi:MAG: FtsX-like permease family protein [Nitrospina sp.]|nr:FtsX-like permease family protein [Nitrospina sp.]MBT3874808.1 FtsX-like permease family protein [Nitrospina sp.]MBT4047807.1 FtsX-like permease family protein [Nitrospina sp.]MBT4558632.1 FtsX-like permease family protein [Nitrospina sp.]MBT5349263.1 FtsX-like permease family protein [Nitrospina sp.]
MSFLFYFKDLFTALILRPLLRDPFRTLITILGVAVGVAVFLSIRLANQQTMMSFTESVDLVLGRANAVIRVEGLDFDESVFEKLHTLRHEIKAYPVIEGYGVESTSGEVIEIIGTDLLQDSGIRDFSIKTVEKDLKGLLPLLLDPYGVILPEKFIPGTQFAPGDTIQLLIKGKEKSLNVNAVLENKGIAKALNGNFALMDIAAAQIVFEKLGRLDRIDIQFLNPVDFELMQKKIAALLPEFMKAERPQRKNRQVEKMLQAFQYNLTALSFVALLVALYLIYNMIALSVVRRRVEIGTLRAIGATPTLIALIFFLEAGVIGALGSLLGIGLGYFFAQFSLDAVSLTVNNLYAPSYVTKVDFQWSQMTPYFILGVTLSFISALIPAWDAATTPPTSVMRRGSYDLKLFRGSRGLNMTALAVVLLATFCTQLPPINHFPYFGFFSVFLIILGVSLLSPSVLLWTRDRLHFFFKNRFGGEGLLACMNLSQNVGRNALAVSSLAIAFMMVISMSIMVHSFRETVIVWIDQTLRADLFVRIAGGRDIDYQHTLPSESVEQLKSLKSVAAVDQFRAIDITYNELPVVLATGDFSVLSQYGNLVIKSGPTAQELDQLMIGEDRALISEAFSLKHKVSVGDNLELKTPNGLTEIKVAAIYFDYSRERGYIILDRTTFLKYYDETEINSFVIYLEDKTRLESIRKEVLKTLKDHRLIIRSNSELKHQVLEVFDKTFAITYSLEIIAILVAVLGLFNTLVSLILERKREIGILRFIGAFTRQIKRMVLIEAGILGLIGSAMGFVAGVIVSYILIFVINKQSFGWTIQVHFPTLFILVMVTLFWGISLLSGLYPARLAAKLNPKEAVRVE